MSALVPLLVTLPLLGAAIALISGRHRRTQVAVSIITLTLVLVIAAVLLVVVDAGGEPIVVSVGGWPVPFGIVLYVDRLAALLVVVSSVCTLLGSGGLPTALTYFIARDRGSARAILGSLVAPVAVQVAATAVVQFGVMFAFVHGDPQRVKVAALVSLLLVPGILAQNYGLAILQGQERFFPFNGFSFNRRFSAFLPM